MMTDKPVETLPNGVEVFQATDESVPVSNIYCEFPWCSPDSTRFVFSRLVDKEDPNSIEYVACEFGSWGKRIIGRSCGFPTMAQKCFIFSRYSTGGRRELVRYDLSEMKESVVELPKGIPDKARLDITVDGRYVAFNQALGYSPQRFGIGLADLKTGRCAIIHEDPWICNTHHQFEPSTGKYLMVQHNRGCRFRADGTRELLCGKEGCTLFLLTIPDGIVVRLPVGPPHTASLSGHETWIGGTRELIATLNLQEDYDFGKGPIIGVKPGGKVRSICEPWQMNHIGIEPSGRVFCADAYSPDEIIIGSTVTNRALVVCPARSSYRRSPVEGHPHAYISPDLRWVVFNSDRTGKTQVYAARLPAGLVEGFF